MFKRKIEMIYQAKLKEKGEDYIVCDVITAPPSYITIPKEFRDICKKRRITLHSREYDVKMKVDANNVKLIKKVKRLKRNRKFNIKISYPFGAFRKTDLWEFIDIIEEKDALIMEKNKQVLFTGDNSLIDKRIAELEAQELLEEQKRDKNRKKY